MTPRNAHTNAAGVLILCLLIAACGSYSDVLRTWEGQPVERLIEKWGYPESVLELPKGHKVYAYHWKAGQVDQWGRIQDRGCRAWMETDENGIIVKWRWQGSC